MMLDAGASSIMNSGFVGRGLKIRGGMFTMAPNTWMSVNGTGDDIRKSFVPMPTKEPSNVLLNLMMYMVEAGQKLSATTDIFSGEHPGQNTKAGVTQVVRDEGQKVFNAIYKRIRNAFSKELDKIYELNGIVLNAEGGQDTKLARGAQMFSVMPEFYDKETVNIQPSADPNTAIKEQKIQAAMAALQLVLQTGVGNPEAAQRRVLVAMEVENVDEIQPADAEREDPQLALQQQAQQIAASQADFDANMRLREQALQEWQAQTNAQLDKARLQLEAKESEVQVQIDLQKFNVQMIQQEMDRDMAIDEQQRAARAAEAEQGAMGSVEGATSN